MFGLLTNVAWTTLGPVLPAEAGAVRLRARAARLPFEITGVDKFPRMTDYVVPAGVRIADADRVRLGAHLAEGTTVMHEGFINYNAGTLGASMVEGRISAGVVVGDHSDIGGGSSIMGTLSGGGTQTVSIGRRCLLGANAGIGISLGDDCTVEAGLYLTAGPASSCPTAGGLCCGRAPASLSSWAGISSGAGARCRERCRPGRGWPGQSRWRRGAARGSGCSPDHHRPPGRPRNGATSPSAGPAEDLRSREVARTQFHVAQYPPVQDEPDSAENSGTADAVGAARAA